MESGKRTLSHALWGLVLGMVVVVSCMMGAVRAQSASDLECALALTGLESGAYPNGTNMLLYSGLFPGTLGDYYSCLELSNAQYCTAMIYLPELGCGSGIDGPLAQCTLGLCVPKVCNATSLSDLLHLANLPSILQGASAEFVCTDGSRGEMPAGGKVMLGITGVLLVLGLLGTVVDLYVKKELKWIFFWKRPSSRNKDELSSPLDKPAAPSKKLAYIRAFSFTANWDRLFAPIPGGLEAFNGLRVMSILWVVLGHTFSSFIGISSNLYYMLGTVINRWSFQFVPNAEYAVDTFFFISGFLVTYYLYKRLRQIGIRKFFPFEFILFYVHRVLRLMPMYIFILGIYWTLTPMMGEGPLWFSTKATLESSNQYCWTNVLFINNFIPKEFYDECMPWAWFLAVDMQLYILTPFYVLTYAFNWIAGVLLIGLTFVAFFFSNGYLVEKYDMKWNFIDQYENAEYFNLVYGRPWTRCSPYLIGMATALILLEVTLKRKERVSIFDDATDHEEVKPKLPWWSVVSLFTLGFAFLFLMTFGTYNSDNWTSASMLTFMMTNRTFWSLGLAILMFLFALGYGGFLRSIFAAKFWDPLAKLTYGTYLIHLIIITVYFGSQTSFVAYTDWNMTFWFIAISLLSYIFAGATYLLVEKPFMNLEALLLKDKSA